MTEVPSWFGSYIERFYYDPLAWALWAFPWRDNPDHPLRQRGVVIDKDGSGLEDWQARLLSDMGRALREGATKPSNVVRQTVCSGRGIGKGAMAAMSALYWYTTRVNAKGVLTANTFSQATTKTWPELRKWHEWLHPAVASWLDIGATVMRNRLSPDRWFLSVVSWDAKRPEAFQGEHNDHPFVLKDEAAGMPGSIYEATEGFFTTGHGLWQAYGNGNRNSGPFFDSHNSKRHLWIGYRVDARSIRRPHNAELMDQWIATYGEDSDFVRVHVKGDFPRSGFQQFISTELIEEARARKIDREAWDRLPLILGADVAGGNGADFSAAVLRQGPWLPTPAVHTWDVDPLALADKLETLAIQREVDAVAVDGNGIGAGTYVALRRKGLEPYNVNAGRATVNVGKKAARDGAGGVEYLNTGTKLWGDIRQWLRDGGSLLHADQALLDDLRNREFAVDSGSGLVMLEPKQIMKARGLPSPDRGDALAHTFFPTLRGARHSTGRPRTVVAVSVWDPLA